MTGRLTRRRLFSAAAATAVALPFFELLEPGRSRAADGFAERFIVFYFPDGVVGPSQDGQPSLWHATGGGSIELTPQLEPLTPFVDDCVFFRGLTLGPADQGSHPGGAVKLLTATDGGLGESIDHRIARTAGADAPFRHVLLGAMANQNNASGDKHISYPSAGNSLTPQDDPSAAFNLLFDGLGGGGGSMEPDPRQVTVIDAALDDLDRLRTKLGKVEQSKLDYHLESLREVESRIKGVADLPTCDEPGINVPRGNLYDPGNFPAVLRAQIDLTVLAMSCGLSRVGVLQCSHHTSDLLMSQFPDTPLYDPGFDMRSHQASHYGPSHNPASNEFSAYLAQRRYWVEQFAYLLQRLSETPDPVGGTMLENSTVLLCTEVCDGNTHLHDDMPFVLAGQAGGCIDTGRVFDAGGQRHAGLLASIAHAMGEPLGGFGDTNTGPLAGLLS